jgi:hypothetical protein
MLRTTLPSALCALRHTAGGCASCRLCNLALIPLLKAQLAALAKGSAVFIGALALSWTLTAILREVA